MIRPPNLVTTADIGGTNRIREAAVPRRQLHCAFLLDAAQEESVEKVMAQADVSAASEARARREKKQLSASIVL